MQRTVEIGIEAISAAVGSLPSNQPIMMINLLRFREHADYGALDNQSPCSGREAYMERYAPVALPLVQRLGGRPLFQGEVLATLVAPAGEEWDEALLVHYPNFSAVTALFNDPAYQAGMFHRTAALEDSRLIAIAMPGGTFAGL